MTAELHQALLILGGSLLGALITDLRGWSTAPIPEDKKWPDWSWPAFVQHMVQGLTVGLSAVAAALGLA